MFIYWRVGIIIAIHRDKQNGRLINLSFFRGTRKNVHEENSRTELGSVHEENSRTELGSVHEENSTRKTKASFD